MAPAIRMIARCARYLARPLYGIDRLSVQAQVKRLAHVENPFVMVVVPGTLHVSEMALRYYPRDLQPILQKVRTDHLRRDQGPDRENRIRDTSRFL